MIDLILRNARQAGQRQLADIGVEDGRIVSVAAGTPAAEIIDLAGRLVTPPLVEPHIHLDAALTVGQPRPNVSGSLFEGIAIWAQRVGELSRDDVQSRARQVLRWQLASGVQQVRSHVDVCDPQLRALRALADLREEARGLLAKKKKIDTAIAMAMAAKPAHGLCRRSNRKPATCLPRRRRLPTRGARPGRSR